MTVSKTKGCHAEVLEARGQRPLRSPFGCLRVTTACFLFFVLSINTAVAQSQYENAVYRANIKSIEFYNTTKPASFPIITLGTSEQVLLAFDDLQGGTKNLTYTIEHCDANWNSSNISLTEYLQNYSEDRLANYRYSTNTVQKYTHYELTLPNENISPKIPGNYILKVYDDRDQSKMILTRRLYVVNPKISAFAEIVPSNDNLTRQTNQKINFTLDYGSLRVQNPQAEVRTLIMQDARPETGVLNTDPANIRGTQLIFNDVNTNDFPSGNEFRHFDTRTLKLNSERILHIYRTDTANTVLLITDPDRSNPNYTFQYDLNGAFYVLNQDGIDPRIDADYVHMYFSFNTLKAPAQGSVYIVGQFNDYKLDEHSKMGYDAAGGKFVTSLYLKQGVYDYTYVWVNKAGKVDDFALEGNHFETENDYQLLVYYRPVGARWEELVGYRLLNSSKR